MTQRASRDGLPSGEGTSKTNDVADPHPSNEEHYDRQKRPGSANPPKGGEAGVEVYRHDGDSHKGYPAKVPRK